MQLHETASMIQQMLKAFAESTIRPVAPKFDEAEEMPWELMEQAAGMGMSQGAAVEAALGVGSSPMAAMAFGDNRKEAGEAKSGEKKIRQTPSVRSQIMMVAAEELAWGCAGISLAINGSGLAATPVAKMGTRAQQELFLQCLEGKDEHGHIKVAAMAMSEPTTGSDISDIRTTARREGDFYILNGSKQWITNGKSAAVYVVWAQTDKNLGRAGVRGFIIPRGTEGLIPGKKEVKLGIRASETAQVHFENCKVPVEWVLGGEDVAAKQGIKGAHAMFDATRPLVAAQAIGIARAAYDYMVEYGKQESLYGKPLGEHQWFAFEVAEMAIEIEAARNLVWKALWMADAGLPNNHMAAMSKAYGAKVAVETTSRAIRLLGNEGWTNAHPVEKWYRDAKIYDIFEGTGQIQRRIIAKHIFGSNAV